MDSAGTVPALEHRLKWATAQADRIGATGMETTVLRHIAMRDSGHGCWQSQSRIAAEIRFDRKSVNRAIQTLSAAGLITAPSQGQRATYRCIYAPTLVSTTPRRDTGRLTRLLDSMAGAYPPPELDRGDWHGYRAWAMDNLATATPEAVDRAWQTWRTRPSHQAM